MKARLRSIWDRSAFLAKSDWAYVAGFLGLVLGVAPMLPGWPTWASLAIAVLGLALSVAVFTYDTRALSRRLSGYNLTPVDPMFATRPSDTHLGMTEDHRGVSYGSYRIDRMLADHATEIRVHRRPEVYQLPRDLASLAPYVLHKTTGSRWPFNGMAMRLATDLDPDAPDRDLHVQPASYFDFLCSNELMKWRVTHGDGVIDPRLDHMVDSSGNLSRLSESQLANIIGISTLAITQDLQVLIVHQTNGNSASGGLWAPSGSGSLEDTDVKEGSSVHDVVTAGVVREMIEETGMPGSLVGDTLVTGYARWMRRGAKPEFFARTLLKGTAAEVDRARRNINSRERIYTGGAHWISLDDGLAAATVQTEDLSSRQLEIRQCASLPLLLALRKLAATDARGARLIDPDVLNAP